MCGYCGCGHAETEAHDHHHNHRIIQIEQDILAENQDFANRNQVKR